MDEQEMFFYRDMGARLPLVDLVADMKESLRRWPDWRVAALRRLEEALDTFDGSPPLDLAAEGHASRPPNAEGVSTPETESD